MRALISLLILLLATAAAHAELQIIGGMSGSGAGSTHSGMIIGALSTPGNDLVGEEKRKTAIVPAPHNLAVGDILVDTQARYLYLALAGGKALRYPVGVGREGYEWSGTNRVTSKKEWPEWRPPKNMIEREAERGHIIPEMMPGGPKNPLGARALYIGRTEYRIHGTTQPNSIGRAVSSGCIRMLNDHVIDLYDRVKVGARITVQ